MQREKSASRNSVAFHICNPGLRMPEGCSEMLRSLAAQLLHHKRDVAAYVYDEYIQKGKSPSKNVLKTLIPDLISAYAAVHFLVDGLDEVHESDQAEILGAIMPLVNTQHGTSGFRVVFFSRKTSTIERNLRKYEKLDLRTEGAWIEGAISAYVHHELQLLRCDLHDLTLEDALIKDLEQKLISKADGQAFQHMGNETLN
jgi:hypothetical protein